MSPRTPGENYRVVRSEITRIGQMEFLIAETPKMGNRTHRRVFGNAQASSPIAGKPILYVDLYGDPEDPRATYIYARHQLDPKSFFAKLREFIQAKSGEFKELQDRRISAWMNLNGLPLETDLDLVFNEKRELDPDLFSTDEQFNSDLRFFRISLPFGDAAIEFGKSHADTWSQWPPRSGQLSPHLESPLVGADLTKGRVLSSLLSTLHWGAQFVPRNVMEELIAQITGCLVTV